MKKISVVVLMGGKSPEFEISLISGREVVKNLDKTKYKALPVIISRSGTRWQSVSKSKLLSLPDPLKLEGTRKEYLKRSEGVRITLDTLRKMADVVFIALHGPFGEDGTVQGMLDFVGISYTGPGVLASALAMDKERFRKLLIAAKIPIPKYISIEKNTSYKQVSNVLGSPPYFVKPHNQGSSVGASSVRNRSDLRKALELAYRYSEIALVDEYLKGLEVTCGIIGNDKPIALPLVEIKPLMGEFFDYESKYRESGAEEIVPARISRKLTKKVQDKAIEVYKLIGCEGFSRVDFIIRHNRYPVVLEVNTIPGLTPMSLFPKAAKAAGFSYRELLTKIIEYGIK